MLPQLVAKAQAFGADIELKAFKNVSYYASEIQISTYYWRLVCVLSVRCRLHGKGSRACHSVFAEF